MVKFYLECFRTTNELNGTKVTQRLGNPDRLRLLNNGETQVKALMQFLKTSCCPDRKRRCFYCTRGYDKWRNLPRGFKIHFEEATNEFWHSNSTSSMESASVYINGGTKEHKLAEGNKAVIKDGTKIFFRPEIFQRVSPYFVNMEFHVKEAVAEPETTATVVAARRDPLPSTPTSLILKSSHLLTPAGSAALPLRQSPVAPSLLFGSPAQQDDGSFSGSSVTNTSVAIDQIDCPFAVAVLNKNSSKENENLAPDPPTSPRRKKSFRSIQRLDPPGSSPGFRSPEPLEYVSINAGGQRRSTTTINRFKEVSSYTKCESNKVKVE